MNRRKKNQKKKKNENRYICKPCWELKYCPYGPLVEDFPIGVAEAAKADELGWYVKPLKGKGLVACDKNDKDAIPDLNRVILEYGKLDEDACEIFGHSCPVFFVSEPFTETSTLRKINRNVSRTMFLRVVRRDNQTCQKCGKILKDGEIMIDHIIPYSKGGPTEESNLRVLCEECNREKSDAIEI
jgi:hypothetical protein